MRLYGPGEVAALFGVSPSAVSMWTSRGTGPLPAPTFERFYPPAGKAVPMWTADQVAIALSAESAHVCERAAELERRSRRLTESAVRIRERAAVLRESAAELERTGA